MSDFLFRGPLTEVDPDVAELASIEAERQYRKLILIASESTAPQAVLDALSTRFHNLYAEGYPDDDTRRMRESEILDYEARVGHFRRYSDPRYYKGTEYANIIESLARRRAAEVFAANGYSADQIYANVQALSGAPANNAVYNALVAPGDTIMGMNLLFGGHLTHGAPANRSGKYYKVVQYTINAQTGRIDMEDVERLALEHKPKMLIVGYSSYPWAADFKRFREIADKVGATLLADMAHVAGLIAAGAYPSPLGIAHVMSFTTHKTLGGPRGAVLLTTDPALAKKLDKAVFPGEQGGPHVNVFAALAVAFKLAKTEQFKTLQHQTVKNAVRLAERLAANGLGIPFGGTESHLLNVDCKSVKGPDGTPLMGDMAARLLDLAGVVVNRNTIPGDTAALRPSGLRLGTPWITQRGFREPEIDELGDAIAQVLKACRPYRYPGRRGDVFRTKVDFDAFHAAQNTIRGLAEKAGIDFEPAAHGYPHFFYLEAGGRTDGRTDRRTISVSGPRAAEFLYWATDADTYALAGPTATTLHTPRGPVEAILSQPAATRDAFALEVSAAHANLVATWLRDLSDGFVAFDDDLYRKLPGPVVVRETAGGGPRTTVGGPSSAVTKPYAIGLNGADGAALPPFVWSEPTGAELKKTRLNAAHRALGAKLVPFAGWEMPVQYTGVLDEHLATRTAAGLFDVSHMGVWDAQGPGAAAFLDAIFANEIAALAPGESCYTHLLAPDAHVLDDAYVYCLAADHFLIVVNASNDDKDWAWVQGVLRGDVCIDLDRPWAQAPGRGAVTVRNLRAPSAGADQRVDLAVQGPKSRDVVLALATDPAAKARIRAMARTQVITARLGDFDLIVSRTGYTGEVMGFELFVHPDQVEALWDALLRAGAKPCGLAARDSLRTEAGLPLYGDEFAGPLNLGIGDAGFDSYVKLHKPWFIGRSAFIAQERARTAEVTRFRFVAKSGRMAHQGDPIVDDKGRVLGYVTCCSIDSEGYRLGQAWLDQSALAEGTPIAIFQSASDQPGKPTKGLKRGERAVVPEAAVVVSRFPKKK
jgi:glycine hydroxymethyltransferase